jgi:CBS-domain-containing membrane protein
MNVFNNWYYSFSPQVANVISENQLLRDTVKTSLYPLIGVLSTSTSVQSVLAFNPELATVMAGLVATTLVGVVYLFPPMLLISVIVHKRKKRNDTSFVQNKG